MKSNYWFNSIFIITMKKNVCNITILFQLEFDSVQIVKQTDFKSQVFEVAPSFHMVEVRKTKGDTLEFHKAWSTLTILFGSKDVSKTVDEFNSV